MRSSGDMHRTMSKGAIIPDLATWNETQALAGSNSAKNPSMTGALSGIT